MANRTDRHVQMLAALLETLHQLRRDAGDTRDAHTTLQGEFKNLQATVSTIAPTQKKPEAHYFGETKKTMVTLVDHINEAKVEALDLKDRLRNVNLAFEEEKAKSIMLEEKVS